MDQALLATIAALGLVALGLRGLVRWESRSRPDPVIDDLIRANRARPREPDYAAPDWPTIARHGQARWQEVCKSQERLARAARR